MKALCWILLAVCVGMVVWHEAVRPSPAPAHIGCYVAARGAWIVPGEYVPHTGHGEFGWTGSVCENGVLVGGVYGGDETAWPKSSGVSGVHG